VTATIQYILSGLAIGGIYALVALGFHIMWSAARAVNFAHGDTLMLGAVLAVLGVDAGMPLAVACLLAIIAGGIFGVLLERFAVRPFAATATSIGWMLTTIAVGVMIEALATLQFGGFSRPLASPGVKSAVHIFGAGVYPLQLVIPVAGIAIAILLQVVFSRTRMGKALLAVVQNPDAAKLMGINVRLAVTVSFMISTALAGLAGLLIAPLFSVHSDMGTLFGIKAFAVAILGGITSASGVMLAGLAYGLIEALVTAFLGSVYTQIVVFSVVILALAFMPNGLMGRAAVNKV